MEVMIKGEFIELNKLLKIADIASSGGIAGMMITSGDVFVDGDVELRKRCKIRVGQTVQFDDIEFVVTGDTDA